MEEAVEQVAATPREGDRRALAPLSDMVFWLKTALDVIGETGVEDADAIADSLAGLVASSPRPPAEETARPLAELDRFFADQADVLEYFVPEAIEHLEAMAQSLIALEGEGSTVAEIAALFRAVHTLKGAAYTVGCGVIGDLAHRIEDMLGEIRERQRPLDRGAIETVFAGLDALRLLVRSGEDRADTRAAAYERAIVLLDAVPPIAAVASPPSAAEAAVAEAVEASATVSAATPSSPTVAERPPRSEPVVAAEPVAPAVERAARNGDRSRSSRDAARRVRPSIRVSLDRLDALMNLVGELVITRSRLERHLAQLEQAGELLSFTQSRMTQTVAEFESKYADRVVPPAQPRGSGPLEPGVSPLGEFFDELEFDRYDDFNLLARRVGEISSDLTEIQHELTGLVRTVREDAGGVQRLSGELRGQITRARMVPVGRLFAPFVRMVRDSARAAGKSVALEVRGETVEMDTTIVELMADPLIHLVRNAIAHGVEAEEARRRQGKPPQGTIHLGAAHKGGSIYIEVADDGRGIDVEAVAEAARRGGFITAEALARLGERDILDLIFLPGLTTATSVTTTAGRGVGMDVVRANVSRLGGEIEVQTEAGRGTRFRIRLPLTVAIADALMVSVGPQTLAIPVPAVKGALSMRSEEVRIVDGVESVEIEGETVDLVRLDRVLQIPARDGDGPLSIVALRTGRRTLAVVVDEFLSKEEIVIKNLGAFLQGIGPFSGATVTGQGRVILLLDSLKLLEMRTVASWPPTVERHPEREAVVAPAAEAKRRVLLVDDSVSVRRFVGGMLERAGFHVVAARDGAEALQQLAEEPVDVIVTDLEMPRLNGYELIRDLNREPTTCDLPVVVLTTRAGAKHVNLARELGVDHYVAKPVDEASFVQLIESLATAAPARAGA
jgi:chemosensory pili system protein ChpA (sensor histidine kinase/response regulator)